MRIYPSTLLLPSLSSLSFYPFFFSCFNVNIQFFFFFFLNYVGQNLQFNFCNSFILVFLCNFIIIGLGYLFPYFLGVFNAFYVKFGSYHV